MTLSGGVSTVSGISVGLFSLNVSAGVFSVAVGSVVVYVIVSVVISDVAFCSGRSMIIGAGGSSF